MAKSKDAAMQAAILADRESDDAMLVYADWLLEQGDPRGDLAVIHRQQAVSYKASRDPVLKKAAAAILAEHGPALLGAPLARFFAGVPSIQWRHGFIDSAHVWMNKRRGLPEPFSTLDAFLGSPSVRFMRRLSISNVAYKVQERVIDAIVAAPTLPPLLELEIQGFDTLPATVLARFPTLPKPKKPKKK